MDWYKYCRHCCVYMFLKLRGSIVRVLIGYEGSRIEDDALNDLDYAGFPEDVEFDILSVSESPPADGDKDEAVGGAVHAKDLTQRLRFLKIPAETPSASAGNEILDRSKAFEPDLIVLGGGSTLDGNIVSLRNTCKKILTQSGCSVRIARGNPGRDESPPRIVIGYDGSPGARGAVEAVVARHWPPNTQVRLVVVTDGSVLNSIGRFSPQMANPRIEAKIASQWAATLAEGVLKRLKDAGLKATLCVEAGSPKQVLVKVAESWNADSIFVGPHCIGNPVEPLLLGSVSANVAAYAHCSVEIVRLPAIH